MRYRDDPAAIVPPKTPRRWEWTPERFEVHTHGAFFEWFLVRRADDPTFLFARDPQIAFVAHEGHVVALPPRTPPGDGAALSSQSLRTIAPL